MIDDERLRLLAFEDRWHFVAVLCLKADGLMDDDRSELWERRLALKLGVQLRELDEIHRRLSSVGLIDADWQPVKWDELQQRSDSSTERTREWRKRQKEQQEQGCDDTKRHGDVTVTPQIRVDKIREELEPKGSCASDDAPAFDVNDFVESWNETAEACGLSKIRKLTDARKRAFNVRRREYPDIADWQRAFTCLRQNKWMHGDNRNGWRADPDFFLTASKFTKLVEGQYGQADRP
jgi:hypothetical protein